jgi:2-phospho-L-lactate/phosphoenolpyruvate guanylyltransferase
MRRPPPRTWSVVVPVKRLHRAKTRLAQVAGEHRERLALALALDTVSAALRCRRVAVVLAVCDDPVARAALGAVGARVIFDEPGAGLNPALAHGAVVATLRRTRDGVAALSADLPCLRPPELGRALDLAGRRPRTFLADADGRGTTLLTALPGVALAPAFGPGSAGAHRASGAFPLALGGLSSLRRDVDTPADLRAARALGVGPRTAAVAALLPGPG